jgi:hypothetical protein
VRRGRGRGGRGVFWTVAVVVGAILVARSGRPATPKPAGPVVVEDRKLGTAIDYAKGVSTFAVVLFPAIGVALLTVKGARWAGVAIPQWVTPRLRRRERVEVKPGAAEVERLMGRPDEVFLGFDPKTGEPVYAPRATVASAAVGGESGSAKTTWALQLIMDRFEAGAKVAVIDPDAKNVDFGLGARLGPLTRFLIGGKVAQTPDEINAVLDVVERDFAEQQIGGAIFETLVVFDEWMVLLLNKDLKARLQRIVSQLAVQGRKWGLSVYLLAQNWKDGTSGMIRDMLVTRVLFRMAKNQAVLCSKKGGFQPADTPALKTGEFYWISPDAVDGRRVQGTNPTADQVAALAARLAEREPVPVLVGGGPEVEGEWDAADIPTLKVVRDDDR